ncbi:S23 ribosomal protein [Leptolyngbyaceae cyanobacterium JSC-12]|nr:S23 ribosomal protein [Leptolyngbyaceae cyanobacterium JSC-12]
MSQKLIQNHEDWEVYQIAFEAAMQIFELSKKFPIEERYSLTDQIRRSSRSVCANLAEAWRKRLYKAAFVAKLNDSAAEAAETQTWLKFAVQCNYLHPSFTSSPLPPAIAHTHELGHRRVQQTPSLWLIATQRSAANLFQQWQHRFFDSRIPPHAA